MLAGRVIPVEELIGRVDDVSADSVRAVAERILTTAPPAVTVVGAGAKSERHASSVARALVG
jgi:predicted Zn-dependent peptidase